MKLQEKKELKRNKKREIKKEWKKKQSNIVLYLIQAKKKTIRI